MPPDASLAAQRSGFHKAHLAWADGDLERFLSYFHEDIIHTVNVDGLAVPYASSGVGKEDVRQRMELLLNIFVVDAFVVENIVHNEETSRSNVLGYYKHKKTGERLDVKFRFVGWMNDGLITRLEEYHDAAYVEAFERFVFHLQEAAVAAANSRLASP